MQIIFFITLGLIFYCIILYPIVAICISFFLRKKKVLKKIIFSEIDLIISCLNEDKILNTVKKLTKSDFPIKKINLIIVDDNSDKDFKINLKKIPKIYRNKFNSIKIIYNKSRCGKTFNQNFVVKNISSAEIIFFMDSNTMCNQKSLDVLYREILSDKKIGYICSKLVNTRNNNFNSVQDYYWKTNLCVRKVENYFGSICQGNGALYAVRKKYYYFLDNNLSHDGNLPLKIILNGGLCKYSEGSIVTESGNILKIKDFFFRYIRMCRCLPNKIFTDFRQYNILKYGFFSISYFSRRFLRGNLFFLHSILFITNFFLIDQNSYYLYFFYLQFIILIMTFVFIFKNINFLFTIFSYPTFVIAQGFAIYKNFFSNNNKAIWQRS